MGTTAEKLAYLGETKTAIKDAITAKGVNVPEGTTFRQYADLISGISTGLSDEDLAKATATPEDVTAGKTFYAGDRELKTGTASAGIKLLAQGTIPSSPYTIRVSGRILYAICAPSLFFGSNSYPTYQAISVKLSSRYVSTVCNAAGSKIQVTNISDNSVTYACGLSLETKYEIYGEA